MNPAGSIHSRKSHRNQNEIDQLGNGNQCFGGNEGKVCAVALTTILFLSAVIGSKNWNVKGPMKSNLDLSNDELDNQGCQKWNEELDKLEEEFSNATLDLRSAEARLGRSELHLDKVNDAHLIAKKDAEICENAIFPTTCEALYLLRDLKEETVNIAAEETRIAKNKVEQAAQRHWQAYQQINLKWASKRKCNQINNHR